MLAYADKKSEKVDKTTAEHKGWYRVYKIIRKYHAFYMIPLLANIACSHL